MKWIKDATMSQWLVRGSILAALVSMSFTAWYGWVSGGGDGSWGAYNGAVAGIVISAGVPLFGFLAAIAEVRGLDSKRKVFFRLLILFGCIDAYSNVGALFTMKEQDIQEARHSTTVAKDNRETIAQLERDIASEQEKIDWLQTAKDGTKIATPGVYSAEIDRLKATIDRRGRNIYERSGQCGKDDSGVKVTEKDSQKLCQDISSAVAMMEMASKRERAEENKAALITKLDAARGQTTTLTPKVSGAETLTSRFASFYSLIVKQQAEPGEITREIAYLILTLTFGIALTILSGALGYGANWLRGGAYVEAEAPVAQNPYIPDQREQAVRDAEIKPAPIPAQSWEQGTTRPDTSQRTVILAPGGRKIKTTDYWESLMDEIEQHLANVQT